MKIIKFNCKLLSDVVINQKAATEGNQESLDFIPGSNFYGIVANSLYNNNIYKNDAALLIKVLHSKKIRFSDAHPLFEGERSLRVPASFFYPKLLRNNHTEYYIHHGISDFDALTGLQLKQCRIGFYKFSAYEGVGVPVNKSFSLKSAYDRELRRSKDAQMYGYQSIDKGIILGFEMAYEEDVESQLIVEIVNALCGEKHVGRSQTAQYGLVEIEKNSDADKLPHQVVDGSVVYVYADGRLIFLDENHIPTFDIKPSDLGFNDGSDRVLWDKSQIRTFQYAPWNSKRQARDTDRCGIEKGSVIVVQLGKHGRDRLAVEYVGSYQNEGFGKVILNPNFLNYEEGGRASCILRSCNPAVSDTSSIELTNSSDKLLRYIHNRILKETSEQRIYERATCFIKDHKSKFNDEQQTFSSQWSAIRKIAMTVSSIRELCVELFEKEIVKNGKNIPYAYLTHGIAVAKWKKNGRIDALKNFIDSLMTFSDGRVVVSDEEAIQIIINLASRMSKICSKTNTKTN